jgi:3-oxoacyl-[acyl-carrier-protein] synthase II
LALVAATEAIQDAGLSLDSRAQKDRVAIVLGTMAGGADEVERIASATFAGRKPSVSDNLGKRPSIALQDIAHAFDLTGPMFSVDAACASGAVALSQAWRLIATRTASLCLAGGTEASIVASNIKLVHSLGITPTSFRAIPNRASRPFDRMREGYVPSEGACFLVLEEETRARNRGARIYARIVGFSERTFGAHPTQISAEFKYRVMQEALRQAKVPVEQLGWVNAHATSTPVGDVQEALAICRIAGTRRLLTSAPKSTTGHLLGASGAFESAFSVLSLRDQCIPG